jgi:hypothetical protein
MWTAPLNVVRFDATTLWHFDAAASAPMYDLFENNNKHPLTGANGSPLKARKERSLEVG